ncbi:MAG: pitrilysin family protein [Gemmatimonadota bacterium]
MRLCFPQGLVLSLAIMAGSTGLPALHAQSSVGHRSQTITLPIQEHILDNGLRVLVLHRPGDARVAAKIFTRMGALNEVPGELGAAHFLEHLMFKGTPTLGTTDWEAEGPVRERMWEVEAELIEEWNRARNLLRQRGVFHDYRHAESTPRLDSLRTELEALEREARAYRDHGVMMRWYQAFGGTRLTATTEQEYMKFDINLPVERVEVFFRLESDRMVNSIFREFDEERMILVEQRFGDLNRPLTPYFEALNASAGRIHPVFWPEGYLPDFNQYTRHYEEELYREFFVPNNTALVLVGGVTLEEMVPLAEKYFGWMERRPEPNRVKATEPLPEAERRLIWRTAESPPRVEVRYLVPGVGHPDRPHFDVLGELALEAVQAALRGLGITARVGSNFRVIHTERFGVPATWNLEVELADEGHLERAEQAVLATLEELATAPPAAVELDRIRERLRTDWYRLARNADALAFEIGLFFTMDRWQTLEEYLNAREATSRDDLHRLVTRYLVPENRTVGIIRSPEPPILPLPESAR